MFAVGKFEIRRRFITDLEPFELDNADVFLAAFPNLALLKFHREKIHPLTLYSREMNLIYRLFLVFTKISNEAK